MRLYTLRLNRIGSSLAVVGLSLLIFIFVATVAASAAEVPSALVGKVIAVDAGHGGIDNGAVGANGSTEKHNTLATAFILRGLLEAEGARVVMTRTSDYLPGYTSPESWKKLTPLIRTRTRVADNARADVLISIHNDANPNPAISGTTTYYWGSPTLAKSVQNKLVASLGSRNVGTVRYGFYVLTLSRTPAVLVELGFLSNWREAQLLQNTWYQTQAAIGIREGLRNYFVSRTRG